MQAMTIAGARWIYRAAAASAVALAALTHFPAAAGLIYTYTEVTSAGEAPPIVHTAKFEGFHSPEEAFASCTQFFNAHPWGANTCSVAYVDQLLRVAHYGWVNQPRTSNYYWYRAYACVAGSRALPPAGSQNGLPRCVPAIDLNPDPPQGCGLGNPIYALTGNKRQYESVGRWLGFDLQLVYDRRTELPTNITGVALGAQELPALGPHWYLSHQRKLTVQRSAGNSILTVHVGRGGGVYRGFTLDPSGRYVPQVPGVDRLVANADGSWVYLNLSTNTMERFDANGPLQSMTDSNGIRVEFTYSDANTPANVAPRPGLLIRLRDGFGRTVELRHAQPAGAAEPRIVAMIAPDGAMTEFDYDAATRLVAIRRPDSPARTFKYEDVRWPLALTGIVSEDGVRWSTYTYDAEGRASLTELAGGTSRHALSYTVPPRRNIVETYDAARDVVWRDHQWAPVEGVSAQGPNGSMRQLTFGMAGGVQQLTSQSQPAGSGCDQSVSSQTFDAQGMLASRDDFNGVRACYANDATRSLELTRVEGLANTAACAAVTAAGASLPVGSRKISSQWHPDWSLPARRAEPRRVTTWVYNGQPDPFDGNAIASCAPANALLPDGKPIAVLCRQVEQATTDEDGAAGLSAPLQAGVSPRVQSWTYNAFGQVLSHDGPRVDVNDVTTFTYYADTTADHTIGDLQSVTNALGQTTQFTKYNKHGQVVEMVAANGTTTVNTYDLRQRLISSTVAGRTTTNTYSATGQLIRTTLADGSYTGFEYDAAQRLTAVHDNNGNRIEYTLDSAGNRISEATKDPAGTLRRALARSYDALGRLQQLTGRE